MNEKEFLDDLAASIETALKSKGISPRKASLMAGSSDLLRKFLKCPNENGVRKSPRIFHLHRILTGLGMRLTIGSSDETEVSSDAPLVGEEKAASTFDEVFIPFPAVPFDRSWTTCDKELYAKIFALALSEQIFGTIPSSEGVGEKVKFVMAVERALQDWKWMPLSAVFTDDKKGRQSSSKSDRT